jgi:hypothetical protein
LEEHSASIFKAKAMKFFLNPEDRDSILTGWSLQASWKSIVLLCVREMNF